MENETLQRLDEQLLSLHRNIGALQMWKQIAELMVPIRDQLPPAFIAAVIRAHPDAKTQSSNPR